MKVLYVLGTQRGGTTIAGRVFGELPGFAFVGELRKLWQVGLPQGRTCGCGLSYRDCPVWSAVLPQVVGTREPTELQRWQDAAAPDRHSSMRAWRMSRSEPGRNPDVDSYTAMLAETYRALGDATGARVIVDTSKLPADGVLVSRLPDVDAYFLQLVRDPRGTVHSALSRGAVSTGPHPRSALAGSAGWLVRHLAARRLLRSVGPARATVVTYERLMAQPNEVLAELARFVGEPAPPLDVVANSHIELTTAHTPIGGGRFGSASVDLNRDDRWVSSMTPADRRLVSVVTWPLARRFGYWTSASDSKVRQ
jgi:sulfotransferase family protein